MSHNDSNDTAKQTEQALSESCVANAQADRQLMEDFKHVDADASRSDPRTWITLPDGKRVHVSQIFDVQYTPPSGGDKGE